MSKDNSRSYSWLKESSVKVEEFSFSPEEIISAHFTAAPRLNRSDAAQHLRSLSGGLR